jgi:hypothetical protein
VGCVQAQLFHVLRSTTWNFKSNKVSDFTQLLRASNPYLRPVVASFQLA